MSLTFGEQRTETQKAYDAYVLARVKLGIAFCEETYGPNWVDHIDLDELNLRDGHACVLGQLEVARTNGEESYIDGLHRYFEGNENKAEEHGFYVRCDEEDEWNALQACWEDVLTPLVTHEADSVS